jgi:two-component system sensor histidine kinase KdpD
VSHDLRTPLGAITGAATTLRSEGDRIDKEDAVELLDSIVGEAARLERLVGNLLDMTRLESGDLRVKREWVPVEELIGAALTRLEVELAERAVSVVVREGTPLVAVDPVLMQQVFVNLLDNACKYTPAGSPLDIVASGAAGSVVIEIMDRGPGLSEASRSKIFDKFERGEHPTGVAGAGLGLAICKGIVEAHGGTLEAAARDGGGAVFRISLPVVGEPPPVSEER